MIVRSKEDIFEYNRMYSLAESGFFSAVALADYLIVSGCDRKANVIFFFLGGLSISFALCLINCSSLVDVREH